jgi:hypothetical protein
LDINPCNSLTKTKNIIDNSESTNSIPRNPHQSNQILEIIHKQFNSEIQNNPNQVITLRNIPHQNPNPKRLHPRKYKFHPIKGLIIAKKLRYFPIPPKSSSIKYIRSDSNKHTYPCTYIYIYIYMKKERERERGPESQAA